MAFEFLPNGVCARKITFDIDNNNVITAMNFSGGCQGNLAGIEKLVIGMKAEDVITKLEGTTCGMKKTSCPDQLSKALKQAVANNS